MFRHSQKTGDFTTTPQIARLSGAALIIGAVCAFIAILLLKMIYLLTNIAFYHRLSLAYITPTANGLHGWTLVPPIVGALLIGLIARYGSEKIRGHGIPEAIEAMLIHESKVQPKVALWKPISAAISIGSGGPFGAEGPIIMTGGSFGSLFSQFLHFSSIERRILLVAGAAGGMSATFSAPVSSVLFAVELLVFEFKPRSLVPIALASAIADAIRVSILGPGPLFGMPQLVAVHWPLIAMSALIGIVGCGLAILLTLAIYGVEDLFQKLPIHWMWWPAIGAIVVGVGGILSPRALGVGYDSISAMLNVKLGLYTLLTLFIVKTIIWIVALGSGTSGGILAPILIIGGSLGALAAQLVHAPHPGVWALLGMSAIFSGVTRTPFTSILFPLELTHNLGALLPLLVTSCVATGLSSFLLPRSILTEKIARRGLHLTREYHADPLQMHFCRELVWLPEPTLLVDTRLEGQDDLMLSMVARNDWVRVVDAHGLILGMVLAWDVARQARISPQQTVGELLTSAPLVHTTDTAKIVLTRLVESEANYVTVVDDSNTVIGFITLHQLMELRKREHANEYSKHRVFTPLTRVRKSLRKPIPEMDSIKVRDM